MLSLNCCPPEVGSDPSINCLWQLTRRRFSVVVAEVFGVGVQIPPYLAFGLGDALANAADYGYCASHSRHFWGFRLHALCALDGTPRALVLTSPKIDEKLVCLQMIARCKRAPGQMLIVIGDKNFRGKDFEFELANLDATIMRPRRKDEPRRGPHLAPIRQRIESIFWTCKDILTLERHGARTLKNLRVRLATRFAALAAAIALNHHLNHPSRSLACYTA
jgi:Transposase DDE domain